MANNEKIKIRIKSTPHVATWYSDKIGKEFEVKQSVYREEDFSVLGGNHNDCYLRKSDCEIIPSTDLIPFDWQKWESGQYEAVFSDSTPVLDVFKSDKSDHLIVLVGNRQFYFALPKDLQLRPKVINQWIIVYTGGMTSELKDECPKETDAVAYMIKVTSDPRKDAPTHCEIVK